MMWAGDLPGERDAFPPSGNDGITLRDYFAAKMVTFFRQAGYSSNTSVVLAYEAADVMLSAR